MNSVISFQVNNVAKHLYVKRMTIMVVRVLLRWTQANSFELVVRQSRGESRTGDWGDRSP